MPNLILLPPASTCMHANIVTLSSKTLINYGFFLPKAPGGGIIYHVHLPLASPVQECTHLQATKISFSCCKPEPTP